ncbi:putative ribonuclease h protein [Quercus suber]|uniref:Ribonuclease h protein n=1 Tax=Quercus suber TaxID=58331 RepID=A0AAW0KEP3_QUESU
METLSGFGEERDEQGQFTRSWVWKINTLPRIKFLMWMCLHNNIGVGDCLARKGLKVNNSCQLCQRELETILHGLRDCPLAKSIWDSLGINPLRNFYA